MNLIPYRDNDFSIGSPSKEVDSLYVENVKISEAFSWSDGDYAYFGNSNDLQILHNNVASQNQIISASTQLNIYTTGAYSLNLFANTSDGWTVETDGDFVPSGNEVNDIGASGTQVDTVYTEGINLHYWIVTGKPSLVLANKLRE